MIRVVLDIELAVHIDQGLDCDLVAGQPRAIDRERNRHLGSAVHGLDLCLDMFSTGNPDIAAGGHVISRCDCRDILLDTAHRQKILKLCIRSQRVLTAGDRVGNDRVGSGVRILNVSEIYDGSVLFDLHRHRDELLASVSRSSQLRQGVRVVGQRPILIVRVQLVRVYLALEPDTGCRIQFGLVKLAARVCCIVGVCVARMLCSLRGKLAGRVRDDDVALAGCYGCKDERDSRHCLSVFGDLDKFQPAADDLISDGQFLVDCSCCSDLLDVIIIDLSHHQDRILRELIACRRDSLDDGNGAVRDNALVGSKFI